MILRVSVCTNDKGVPNYRPDARVGYLAGLPGL